MAIPIAGVDWNVQLVGASGAPMSGMSVDTELPTAALLVATGVALPTTATVASALYGYNGTTLDLLKSTVANGLAVDVTRVTGTVTVDSELPAAAALTTAGFAVPTTPTVASALYGYNGSTLDLLKSTVANGLAVDVTRVTGTVTVDTELPAAGALVATGVTLPTTPTVGSALYGYNGSTLDLLKADTTNGLLVNTELPAAAALTTAGFAVPTTPTVASALYGYNGSTLDLLKSTVANGLAVDVTRVTGTVTVDTELPAAALDGDTFDTAVTAVPKVGAILHVVGSGGTLAIRPVAHTSATDGRANTLNGLLVQNVPYLRNASNTNDAQRGANAGTGTTGTGVPCAAPMLWDGSTNYVRSRGDTSGFQQLNAGGSTATISTTLTRPGNTTAYTANDEMADNDTLIKTLTSIATKSGGSGIITHVSVSVSSNAATKPDLTLFFYDTTSTPATDNLAFPASDGVQDTCIGYVRLTDTQIGDATSNTGNFVMDSGQIHIPFTCVGSANLFVRVKVNNAYTAGASSDTHKIRVKALQDY